MAPAPSSLDAVRADVWLWAARFFKTRRLSHEAISGGRITVNDAPCKPARFLKAGDVLDARETARELARLRGPAGPAARPDKSARRVLRRLKHGQ